MKTFVHPYSNATKFIVDTVNDINFFLFNTDEEKYLSFESIFNKMSIEDLITLIESNIRKSEDTIKYLQNMKKLAPQSEYDEYCQAIIEEIEDHSRLEALLDDIQLLQLCIIKNGNYSHFELFLVAYSNGYYKKALSIWDNHHNEFTGNQKIVSDTIITLIDPPKAF
jgi:hypothetical protein